MGRTLVTNNTVPPVYLIHVYSLFDIHNNIGQPYGYIFA